MCIRDRAFTAGGDVMYNEKKIPWYWILLCAGLLSGACIANLVQAQGGIGVSLWGDEIQEKLLLVKGVPVSYLKYLAPRRLGGCVLLLLAGQTIFGKIVNGIDVYKRQIYMSP